MSNIEAIAGIDAGAYSTKAVIISGDCVLGHAVAIAKDESSESVARQAIEEAASTAGIRYEDVRSMASTGMGRMYLPSAQMQFGEASCLAKGINVVMPTAHTVLDVGALKSLAVHCVDGSPLAIAGNDYCASCTGSYLKNIADVLGVSLERIGDKALRATEKVDIQSSCAIFVESEVISLVHTRKPPEDILWGAIRALAVRLSVLLTQVDYEQDVAFVGGMAKNAGLIKALEEQIQSPIHVPAYPIHIGAIGAAILCSERLESSR